MPPPLPQAQRWPQGPRTHLAGPRPWEGRSTGRGCLGAELVLLGEGPWRGCLCPPSNPVIGSWAPPALETPLQAHRGLLSPGLQPPGVRGAVKSSAAPRSAVSRGLAQPHRARWAPGDRKTSSLLRGRPRVPRCPSGRQRVCCAAATPARPASLRLAGSATAPLDAGFTLHIHQSLKGQAIDCTEGGTESLPLCAKVQVSVLTAPRMGNGKRSVCTIGLCRPQAPPGGLEPRRQQAAGRARGGRGRGPWGPGGSGGGGSEGP